ncbi:MAG: metallophosphoesterase [Candidatus Omnitrophica bacterium]|nr:metallophosphoesterase [Candidatus Omnitrophota bacterium]
MKTVWLTDIHLNFLERDQVDYFLEELSKETADCYLISGDIGEADSIVEYLQRMMLVLKRPIYFVLGNHDYYRGSIKTVRSLISDLMRKSDKLIWLNNIDHISLTKETALIGHDSWADGRLGDFRGSSVELNDFRFISELKLWDRTERLQAMQGLAEEAAAHFKQALPQALKAHRHIIVVTHVPPFKEACWHQGRPSEDDWLPFFACKAVGDVLKDVMEQNPASEMTVFCGHTHGLGACQILPNLKVLTGSAEYGSPQIQRSIVFR